MAWSVERFRSINLASFGLRQNRAINNKIELLSVENNTFFYAFSLCVTHSLPISGRISIHFAVKKFVGGQHLLMESNFLFRPSVELLFFDGNATAMSMTCPSSDTCSSTTARQDCFTMKCDEGDSRRDASEAKIVTKIYFKRNSILFQVGTAQPISLQSSNATNSSGLRLRDFSHIFFSFDNSE